METINLSIRPIQPFGAEVGGVDLSEELPERPQTPAARAVAAGDALLVFRDQHLTKEQQQRVATIFGTISEQGVPTAPAPGGVNYVTNIRERGIGADGEMYLVVPGELRFHLDNTFYDEFLKGIMLYAIEVPPRGKGGATLFSDIRKAYRLVPQSLRDRIAGLRAQYSFPKKSPDDSDQSAIHSLVHQHPDTGETLLFLSRRHADFILDLSHDESEALMDELSAYIERPEIVYKHDWTPNDLVVWDNLAIQHAREDFDPTTRRHLRRTQFS